MCSQINRLKDEQGKPDIKANKKKDENISSETERKEAEANANKGTGESGDHSEREKTSAWSETAEDKNRQWGCCPVDKAELPADLAFKGFDNLIVQDLISSPIMLTIDEMSITQSLSF